MALAEAASITIVNRDPTRGSELVALLNEKTPARADLVGRDRAYRIPETSYIIVNATSTGLFPHVEDRLDLDLDSLRPGLGLVAYWDFTLLCCSDHRWLSFAVNSFSNAIGARICI